MNDCVVNEESIDTGGNISPIPRAELTSESTLLPGYLDSAGLRSERWSEVGYVGITWMNGIPWVGD
jgi:hypothetical protein